MFYGIIVYLYYLDTKQHKLPHIHVKYQENEAILSIPEGLVLEGSIPQNKLKLVEACKNLMKHLQNLTPCPSPEKRGERLP